MALTLLGLAPRARFRPNRPLELTAWFRERDRKAQERMEEQKRRASDRSYVEKGNKDETFRYHIAKVAEEDDSLQEEPCPHRRRPGAGHPAGVY